MASLSNILHTGSLSIVTTGCKEGMICKWTFELVVNCQSGVNMAVPRVIDDLA